MQTNKIYKEGFITRLVEKFLTSRLSIVLILLSVALGLAALWGMPKEEDPQIVVPMADVFVSAPGASAEEVHSQVSTPLERLLLQTKGVEDVYSVSKNGQAIVTAKFYVGTNQEDALVRLNNQIQMHQDEVPAIVKKWIVKPVSIDDVPIVNITFYSSFYNAFQLRQIAQEVLTQLSDMPEISKTYLLGGNLFQARIILDPIKLSGMGLGIPEILQAIQRSNMAGQVGSVIQNDHSSTIEIQSFLKNTDSLKKLVVAVHQGRPIYLYQVAEVLNGSSDDETYANIGFQGLNQPMAAVTIGLAKKSGTNAVLVSNQILSRLNQLKTTVIPNGVSYQITRNYGETAHEKVNELLFSLGLAISTVIIVLILFLGWREALIVAVSVPISFALALFLDYLLGYSINRVTLFALILSLGLVVDDPITNVENIQRHIRLKQASFFDSILIAVNEVLPPVIMASLTIIVSFLPLFFITGMMGPYMSPMAATVPLTIIFSTIASLTVVPWMAYKLLASRESGSGALTIQNNSAQHDLTQHDSVTPEWIRRNYRRIVEPFLESRKKRYGLLLSMLGTLVLCGGLVFFNQVPLQLLPFDNNNVLQLVINLPEGATLEDSARTVSDFESYLKTSSYIQSFTAYIGTPAPMDFNGMVRHYYLRSAPNLATIDIGNCQRSCHFIFLKNLYETIILTLSFLFLSSVFFFLSGFKVTTASMAQLRVFFDQRSGFFSLADS